jgi:Phage integrase SAM-like domain
MASIVDDPNGRKRIQFVAGDGSRKAIRLGKVTTKQAEAFKVKVEALIGAAITGALDDEVSRWLVGLDDKMHARLAAVGLVKPRRFAMMTLGEFVDAYIADRTDAKPRTIINLKAARKELIEFFGPDRPLRDISDGDADEFWRYLLRPRKGGDAERKALGQNTSRRICGRAKQFFRAAIRKRLVQNNPFADIKSHVQGNPQRDFFVTREMAVKVLNACPDAEWRMIFALSRYGGATWIGSATGLPSTVARQNTTKGMKAGKCRSFRSCALTC